LKFEDLTEIDGISATHLGKLRSAGYTTVPLLATATQNEIREALGLKNISKNVLKIWRAVNQAQFVKASEYHRGVEFISTGSKKLDELLGGGVETGCITEIAGKDSSGKTQLCHELAVNVQKSKEQGGLESSCIFFDSETTFRNERVLGIGGQQSLERILVAPCYTSDHQLFLLQNCAPIIEENNVRLLIVDSLVKHFRSEFKGRDQLSPRQQKLNSYINKLHDYAKAFNLAVVVTNQAIANPQPFGASQNPTGGNIMGHGATTRIWIRHALGEKRIAKLTESPYLAEGQCVFKITGSGIEDCEEE